MKRKKGIVIMGVVVACFAVVVGVTICEQKAAGPTPDEMVSRLGAALGDEYKKQFKTELAATMIYQDQNDEGNKICYRILKTTYYGADPAEVTGLHAEAFNVLFPIGSMDSREEMKIQDWDAALYKKGDVAYLCWTCSPEISYALEYNPNTIADSEIVKMAESAKVMDEQWETHK